LLKAVVQRCRAARVEIDGMAVGSIAAGLTVFVGVCRGDDEAAAARLAKLVARLRILDDGAGRFGLSLAAVGGSALVVPNFTLCANTLRGARPGFSHAAPPAEAQALYESFVTLLGATGVVVETGSFGAAMTVHVENDGPVTIILDTCK
jgi:D-tyrosyl-tRNA(Tyr) deacylase